jgi:hypothetical protein
MIFINLLFLYYSIALLVFQRTFNLVNLYQTKENNILFTWNIRIDLMIPSFYFENEHTCTF